MRRRLVVAGMVFLLAAACVSTSSTLVDPTATPHPAVSPDSVVIYTSIDELEGLEYQRIAIIEASASGEFTNQSDMLAAMREEAGEVGANGILLPEIEEPSAGARVAAAFLGTGTQRSGNVVAIRVIGRASP